MSVAYKLRFVVNARAQRHFFIANVLTIVRSVRYVRDNNNIDVSYRSPVLLVQMCEQHVQIESTHTYRHCFVIFRLSPAMIAFKEQTELRMSCAAFPTQLIIISTFSDL